MNKRILICAIIIIFIVFIAIFIFNTFEIYQTKTYEPPSWEAVANKYHAMDRWLKETGHSVRIAQNFNPSQISSVPENLIVVFASAGNWDNAYEYIIPWIEKGNSLLICMDYEDENSIDENLISFLSTLGIPACKNYVYKGFDNSQKEADIYIGEGNLTVMSYPYFMQNDYLYNEGNARLAWELTGARISETNKSIVFYRTRHVTNSMFGKIMDKGILYPVLISAFLIIFIGFWMVIPVFGLVFEKKQNNSRPIIERFDAEINFLKKHKSLDYYLETIKNESNTEYHYKNIITKLRSVHNGTNRIKH